MLNIKNCQVYGTITKKKWLVHLNRGNEQTLNFWLTTKSLMSTPNLTSMKTLIVLGDLS